MFGINWKAWMDAIRNVCLRSKRPQVRILPGAPLSNELPPSSPPSERLPDSAKCPESNQNPTTAQVDPGNLNYYGSIDRAYIDIHKPIVASIPFYERYPMLMGNPKPFIKKPYMRAVEEAITKQLPIKIMVDPRLGPDEWYLRPSALYRHSPANPESQTPTTTPGPCVHVFPVGDMREHVLIGTGCWCNPHLQDGVVVHNSMDGRELVERHGLQ